MVRRKKEKGAGGKNAGRKRKLDDPVTAAALDALFDSSSNSSSDDDEDGAPPPPPALPPPKKKAKTKKSSAPGRKGGGAGKREREDLRRLKPLLDVGDEVVACWWPDEDRQGGSSWHPGIVRAYREEDTGGRYGPTRTYDISYDDGDELDDVEEQYTFPKNDYILSMKNGGKSNWIGVKNVNDPKSKDKWASVVGWYVATIDGEERPFSLLSDAINAYDSSVVEKGVKVKRSELNCPEKYSWIFEQQSSDSEEGVSKGGKMKGGKNRKMKKQQKKKSSGKNSQSTKPSTSPGKRNQTISPSTYIGVSYSKKDRKYLAQIEYDGTIHCLGYYKFEVDAALAVDIANPMLGFDTKSFASRREYKDALRQESKDDDPNVSVDADESYNLVTQKVGVYISKIYAREYEKTTTSTTDAKPDKQEAGGDCESGDGVEANKSFDTLQHSSSRGDEGENAISAKEPGGTRTTIALPKSSKFTGVFYNKSSKTYWAQIFHNKQRYSLGRYHNGAEAAVAYDQASTLLQSAGGKQKRKLNFTTTEGYPKITPKLRKKIQSYLIKIPNPELQLIDEAMAKKWAHFLPQETGPQFHEKYEKGINDMVSSNEQGGRGYIAGAGLVGDKPDAYFKPIQAENVLEERMGGDEDSNDDKPLFSDSSTDEEGGINPDNVDGSKSDDKAATISQTPAPHSGSVGQVNASNKLPVRVKEFALGCPVIWGLEGDSFQQGTVVSSVNGGTAYLVKSEAANGEFSTNVEIPAKELAFGIDCPVYISEKLGPESRQLKGQVLFCHNRSPTGNGQPLYFYTILVAKEGNLFQIMRDVPSDRVSHRRVVEAESAIAIRVGKFAQTDALKQPEGGRTSAIAEDSGSQCSSQKIFSSNSTITSVESAPQHVHGSSGRFARRR